MTLSVTCNTTFAIIFNCVEINKRITRFLVENLFRFSLESIAVANDGDDELGGLHKLKGIN
jgi:hypothetical protein